MQRHDVERYFDRLDKGYREDEYPSRKYLKRVYPQTRSIAMAILYTSFGTIIDKLYRKFQF